MGLVTQKDKPEGWNSSSLPSKFWRLTFELLSPDSEQWATHRGYAISEQGTRLPLGTTCLFASGFLGGLGHGLPSLKV